MSLKKLLLSFCPLLLFGKLEFCHTFSLIQQHKNYRKCMEDVKFSKSAKGLLCTPRLVYSFFKFIS